MTHRQRASNFTGPRIVVGAGFLCLASLVLLGTAGCKMFQSTADSERLNSRIAEASENPGAAGPVETASATAPGSSEGSQVRLDGSLSLGDTDEPAFTAAQLASVVGELLTENKQTTVATLVGNYPDIVHQILADSQTAPLPAPQRIALAGHYLRRWGGDQQALEQLANQPLQRAGQSFREASKQFRGHLENNQPQRALELDLRKQAGEDAWLLAEADRLEGIAHLMSGNHSAAAKRLDASATLLRRLQPIEANRVLLLLGEVHRRGGNLEAWEKAWETATVDHSQRLAQYQLHDPGFWRQAAFLKPLNAPWPAAVIDNLRQGLQQQGLAFDDSALPESIVWASVGNQSLARHEAQNAILAFKKSEATVRGSDLKQTLQLRQAMAMIDAGQAGPASAILLRISSHPGALGDRAKAILGTLKLQTGSLAQGMNLLQSSIGSCAEWPTDERLRAQADYGLAYLMRGRESQGLELLDQVHQEFLKMGDYEQASQCLFNIATYFDKTDKPREYKAALQRLEAFESQVPL